MGEGRPRFRGDGELACRRKYHEYPRRHACESSRTEPLRRRQARLRRKRPLRRCVQPDDRRAFGPGALCVQSRGGAHDRQRKRDFRRLVGDFTRDAGARDVPLQGADRAAYGRAGGPDRLRARQGALRRKGLGPAGARGGRVRLRHSAPDEGRVLGQYLDRDGPVLAAPAARGVRGDHTVQFPGDGADVDVPGRDRLRQHLHPQAFREGPVLPAQACRADARGGCASRRVERRERRQGGGGHPAHRSARRRGEFRRLDADRQVRFCDRLGQRQACAGAG